MKTVQFYYIVDRRDIAYLRFIVEAYDGMAVLSTVDSHTGLVVLNVAPGCEDEAVSLVSSLSREIRITPATVCLQAG